MGNFSRDPDLVLDENLQKKYVGVRIEQNVPLLDRDLNLAVDLLGADLRKLLQRYVGDGTALGSDTAFAITAADPQANDFKIGAGKMLVGGIEIEAAQTLYSAQSSLPLKPPAEDQPMGFRIDTVYVDVWLQEIVDDPTVDLLNAADINVPTSTRLKAAWKVRVAEEVAPPSPLPGHAHAVLAQIFRTGEKIAASQIFDRRVHRLQLADLVKRVDALEADITMIKEALKPAFWTARPFDKPSGYNGREVVLYGRNFDFGAVKVYAKVGQGMWLVEIVGDPQPNMIVVYLRTTTNLPYGIPAPGDLVFTVETAFGQVDSPVFRNWGQPTFDAEDPYTGTGAQNNPFVFHGQFLDAPNLEIEIQAWGSPNGPWSPLQIDATTATTATISGVGVGQFRVRMRSEVSTVWTSSAFMFNTLILFP